MGPFQELFVYSLAIIILPIATLFIVDNYFPMVYATIASVCVVHLVLLAFVIKAYRADAPAKAADKSD